MQTGEQSEEDYAIEQARATGRPFELESARTETTDTWAQPDGTWTVNRHGTAVRVFRDDEWIPTDPTLVRGTDGAVRPTASLVDVTFSGGGTAPLLSGVKDGRELKLNWPTALPVPTLAGNVATYAEVLPGVDLQLKAEIEGFSQLLVVKTAEAAQNPALDSLKFKFSTVGLDVSVDGDTGSLTAVDPSGHAVFSSPSPLMWDSTTATSGTPQAAGARAFSANAVGGTADDGTTAPGDTFDPPPGATDAPMETAVTGDTLEIKPDQALLAAPETQYPVYIDPQWAWGERQNWTRVYERYPNYSFWNSTDPIRVGYEAQTGGLDRVSRSFVQMDTSDVMGADVKKATFRVKNIWSWSCQSRPVELWHTTGISSKTTWNRQPTQLTKLSTVNDSKGWNPEIEDCGAGNLEFDLTAKVKARAKEGPKGQGMANITLGLYASDEKDTFAWKKFDPKTATLEIQYNTAPKRPEGLGTYPRTDCKTGGVIGNTRVSLYAKHSDKEAGNLTAQFNLFKAGAVTPFKTMAMPALKEKVTTWAVPDIDLPTGDYTWNVATKDQDQAWGPTSVTCKFTVDRTRPSSPPIISSTTFPNGEKGWPASTGQARKPGTFTFAPNNVSDVVAYHYWTDTDPDVTPVGVNVPVTITPPSYGPHFVYAYSVDKAGNRSDTATYIYYATRSVLRDQAFDLNGDGNRDIWAVDGNGTLLTYAGQGSGEFSNATNGGASFADKQVSAFGDWGQDGYNDLVTLEYDDVEKRKRIFVYDNDGQGRIDPDKRTELKVTCPVPNELDCFGEDTWTGDDHWFNADQVAAPGDLNRDGQPDLLVKQGKLLWAYYGNRATDDLDLGFTRSPSLVGGTDWDKYTIITPGDVSADGLPDLWLRNDATGDIEVAWSQKARDGGVNTATLGLPAMKLKIGSGVTKAAYPVVGSSGDLTNDPASERRAELWARKASDNTLVGWRGIVPSATSTLEFGARFTIDGVTGGAYIPSGTTIPAGTTYTSNAAKLTMRTDGNLVVTSNAGTVLWSSNTAGNVGAKAVMQSDGKLVVTSAAGGQLWTSGVAAANGYAMLQDRGSLVVYDAAGRSKWSTNTVVRHDYDGDGRSDMAAWYAIPAGTSALHSFVSNSDGTFRAPLKSYESAAGSWNIDRMQFVTGDFNGDGRGDKASLYDYGNGVVKLFTATGKAGGGFNAPVPSWSSGKGGFYSTSMTLMAGDFNGDGRDDIAAWYAYAAGNDTIFTFTANVQGGFNAPFPSAQMPAGWWYVDNSKFVTGDFNGDGRDDIAALYGYSDGALKMHTFPAGPGGVFPQISTQSWSENTSTWGSFGRTYLHAGDFNGDGLDDIGYWYDYADGHDALFKLPASAARDGKFGAAVKGLDIPSGNWYYQGAQYVTGDYNGDGKDDIGSLYGFSTGAVKTFTHVSTATGFEYHKAGWGTETGWTWSRATVLRPYNN
ncbi:FG-GAP-like repeat-containing protein [Streptomyces venezuelae]|uniref:FG-GAP-like repeat-containing protein n=1 Tax=Streptomyces venezuelae TaxID=54571 RepID=UPI001CC268B4|nr:FG-GAP-like repeat-containing protein [Streptomyces venezuelae]